MSEEPSVAELVQEYTPAEPAEAVNEAVSSDALTETKSEETSSTVAPAEGDRVLKYKGEELSMDDDRYKNYAQKGYAFEQNRHQQIVDRKLFDKEKEDWHAKNSEIEQINEYAKANPQFEQLIQHEWAKIQNGETRQLDPQTEMQVMQAQLRTLLERDKVHTEATENRRVAELEATQEGAISKFKEEHAYLDWTTKDDQGFSLEDHVGQKMEESRVKDFEVMARSMLLDKIIAHKTMEGKESAAKGIQKANKLGLGKVTEKSQLAEKTPDDISKLSYEDLMAIGLKKYGYK